MSGLGIDFFGITKMPCVEAVCQVHVAHFWYDPTRFRRYFCGGEA